MAKMDVVLGKLAKNASTMTSTIEAARTRARQVGRKLKGLEALEDGKAEEILELEPEFPALEDER